MNKPRCETDKNEDRDDLQQDHYIVGFGRLADSPNEDHGKQHYDDERGPIEAKMPARGIEHLSLQIGEATRKIGGRNTAKIRAAPKPLQQSHHITRGPYPDRHTTA